jgi:aspartyl-tRNA(Asn)/glutamyl-tRNA(Gln) amidotransferase subunit A
MDGIVEDIRLASTRLVRPFNVLGWPALSIPCGRSREGMPIGLQLVAPPGHDESLLSSAESL